MRTKVRTWLRGYSAPLAELYESVVYLRFESAPPVRALFVAHGIREMANVLPEHFGVKSKGRAEYFGLVRAFASDWLKAGLPVGAMPLPTTVSGHSGERDPINVSPAIVEKIARLIDEHERATGRAKSNAEALFRAINEQRGAPSENLYPLVEKWLEVCEWFVGKCHLARDDKSRLDAETFDEGFEKNFELFENLLYALAADFFDIVKDLNAILDEANR